MACSSTDKPDSGFATPAATVISLVLAVSIAAVVTASEAELMSARADLERAQITAALAGAQQQAVLALLETTGSGALRWSEAAAGRSFQVLAEPEALKASITAVIAMDDRALAPFHLADPGMLRERLKTLSLAEAVGAAFDQADPSPVWRACARSLISPFGLMENLRPLPAGQSQADVPTGHAGQLWRLRVSDASGWVDDRVIRLTSDNLRPAATLERRFTKPGKEDIRCDAFFDRAT